MEPAGEANQRVLIIEDNADVAETLAYGLAKIGYEVRTARDGLSGLETAVAFRPQIVMIDIRLPVMNGWEVAERFSSNSLFRRPRLLAITALGSAEHRARSMAAGFEEHLQKPIKLRDLHRVLARQDR